MAFELKHSRNPVSQPTPSGTTLLGLLRPDIGASLAPKEELSLVSARISAASAIISTAALCFGAYNLRLVEMNMKNAQISLNEQLTANLARFSLRQGNAVGEFVLRNVGVQPGWGLAYKAVRISGYGKPVGEDILNLGSSIQDMQIPQPSSLGAHDEVTIKIPTSDLEKDSNGNQAGLLLQFQTVDGRTVRNLFVLGDGGQRIYPVLMN